ncbi:hypothetical protein E5288_WYG014807 [Bos mutus]|uniref:Uncharacterized protein n=1 Tax=Bos mutus TaxID=72004 RepID=A0A6B0S606_9CETA|nr:hypothetical protein [Bos mutus]
MACADSDVPASGAGLRRRAVAPACLLENSNRGLKPHCNAFSYSGARRQKQPWDPDLTVPHREKQLKSSQTVQSHSVHWLNTTKGQQLTQICETAHLYQM